MALSRISEILKSGLPGQSLEVAGWVRTRRDSKQGFSFIELNDGSCLANLQIVVGAEVPDVTENIKHVTTGASVRIDGELKESPGKGQRVELVAQSLRIVGTADAEAYPLQKKRHSFEFLREIAHLRPRTNTFGAIARVRNEVCASIHRFFQSRGFLYIQTPIITTSDCEGAGAMFQVTTLDLAKLPHQLVRRRQADRRRSTTRTTSSASGLRSPSAASSRPRSSPRRSAAATPSGRRFVPRTRTRPGTWPSSG